MMAGWLDDGQMDDGQMTETNQIFQDNEDVFKCIHAHMCNTQMETALFYHFLETNWKTS